MGGRRVIRLLGGPRRIHRRLGRGDGDGGVGLSDLAGQVQTGPLGHLMLVQPARPRRGRQARRHRRRQPRQWRRRAPAAQRTTCHPQVRCHLAQRLPLRQLDRRAAELFCPLQARAVLHRAPPLASQARAGGERLASGLKSVAAGPSDILDYPGLVCTSKGMNVRRSCQPPQHLWPISSLGLGRIYDHAPLRLCVKLILTDKPRNPAPESSKPSALLQPPSPCPTRYSSPHRTQPIGLARHRPWWISRHGWRPWTAGNRWS